MERFGVKMRYEDELVLFKYSQTDARFSQEVTHECRGVILERVGQDQDRCWSFLSRPFDKFFNLDESYCPLFKTQVFDLQNQRLSLREKVDGTCIQLWFHPSTDQWRVSTLGMITTSFIPHTTKTFSDLFHEIIGPREEWVPSLDRENTYLFELCSAENQLVTEYEDDQLIFLGARHTQSGRALPIEEAQTLVDSQVSIRFPKSCPLLEHKITTALELRSFVERASCVEDYGLWPEGFVLYDGLTPIAKIKNHRYLQRHFLKSNDEVMAHKKIIEAAILGSLDDLWGFLNPTRERYAEKVQREVKVLKERAYQKIDELYLLQPTNKKDFAIPVTQLGKKNPYQSFFFKNQELILSQPVEAKHQLEEWGVLNYKRFIKGTGLM